MFGIEAAIYRVAKRRYSFQQSELIALACISTIRILGAFGLGVLAGWQLWGAS